MIDTSRDPAEIDPTRIDAEPIDEQEEAAFSDEHPLASPNELAGDAASGLELEFAARDLSADAEGAASGMMLEDEEGEEDTLPLEGY